MATFNFLTRLRRRAGFSVVIALVFMSLHISMADAETWVVTDRQHPVQLPPGARLILLDEAERLEQKLSEGLPADPRQAMAIIQQRLRTADAQRLQNDLVIAQQGIADAWGLGISKIPAVVVDKKYVVYGETNASVAVQLVAQLGGNRP